MDASITYTPQEYASLVNAEADTGATYSAELDTLIIKVYSENFSLPPGIPDCRLYIDIPNAFVGQSLWYGPSCTYVQDVQRISAASGTRLDLMNMRIIDPPPGELLQLVRCAKFNRLNLYFKTPTSLCAKSVAEVILAAHLAGNRLKFKTCKNLTISLPQVTAHLLQLATVANVQTSIFAPFLDCCYVGDRPVNACVSFTTTDTMQTMLELQEQLIQHGALDHLL